jgi:hypothetical protein
MRNLASITATANIAEYAAKNGIPFWLAMQVADCDYLHVMGDIGARP